MGSGHDPVRFGIPEFLLVFGSFVVLNFSECLELGPSFLEFLEVLKCVLFLGFVEAFGLFFSQKFRNLEH